MTDISRTSVTLSWKSNPNAGATATSYLIEAFRLDIRSIQHVLTTYRILQLPSAEASHVPVCCHFSLQLHIRQQMGDPSWAYKDTDLCREEPEACNCLPVYGQSGKCLWTQWPQSNLRLCPDTGSVCVLFTPFLSFISQWANITWNYRRAACVFQFKWLRHCCCFLPCVCTNRQHFHRAGSGSPSHPEGAGRRSYPPTHTGRPFIFCCQGAVDGKRTEPWWLSCTQATFLATKG